MLALTVDEELSALGQVPSDVRDLVTRILGDQPITTAAADALLASLSNIGVPSEGSSASRLDLEARGLGAVAVAQALDASALVFEPAPLSDSVAPLFDSRPLPPSAAPAVFETGSVSADPSSDPSIVFDAAAETTAQAIVAAFDDPDAEPSLGLVRDPLDALAAAGLELGSSPPAKVEPEHKALRMETRGSRRPDLDELLDQPLDALDFERTEPVPRDEADAEDRRVTNMPTSAPSSGASGDDFEILVDDEILEIAEDDVELVDDEPSN